MTEDSPNDETLPVTAALRASEARLAAEASALTRLNDASSRLWRAKSLREGLGEMLSATLELVGSEMGLVQILDQRTGALTVAAHRGFGPRELEVLRNVSASDHSACGRALRLAERTVIDDVESDPLYTPFKSFARTAGYRSVLSVPLIGRDGLPLGLLSTQFRQVHRPHEHDLRRLDLYARQAADFIERCRGDDARRESEARFREMADHAPGMVWVNEPDGKCSFISRSWYEYTGQSPETGLEHAWLEALHPEDRPGIDEILRTARGRKDPFQVEYRLRRHDGVYKWWLDVAAPRFAKSGEFLGYIGSIVDISERKEAELALAEREAQLALADKAAKVGGWILDVPADRIQVTEGYAAIYQLPPGTTEITVAQWRAFVHPDDINRLDERRARSFAEHQRERVSEYRIVRRDGVVRWIESRGFVTYDSAGKLQHIVGINIDITDRKQADERQRHLIAELDHRVKNVLAKVAIIAARTREASNSLEEFSVAFEGRIRSMASTHDLLSRNHWRGAPLVEIVRHELAAYATGGNTIIEGPQVILVAEAGQAVATVLHELATNAAKYGALSVPDGGVTVRWNFEDGAIGPARLAIRWEEHGGPPVEPPTRTGFGTGVIRGTISHQLDGRAELTFEPRGVCCLIELPLSRIEQVPL